ncbi:Host cell surface-exposed lipoprotein [Corynebacterium heidelbergense]|uniref:Putative host cell surface-exposed lipoprotein Ltp-like HTH region domain-containing protein n=1 Tax=Corynebacterium heidelbergense TaxID=2055947 RepID=A0A364VEB9_9CORY|nr:Ltp family lipoprotein [Corynebacterium heidelbergense]RAV34961.1 hypothetical protein CWC39_00420 [Corynebacterium heidelbergense]WCZ35883.1 Host cell surface-exposed lipoprotein [Corynebacterium heidelbergense]
MTQGQQYIRQTAHHNPPPFNGAQPYPGMKPSGNNKTVKWIVGALAAVLILGGSAFIANYLGSNASPEGSNQAIGSTPSAPVTTFSTPSGAQVPPPSLATDDPTRQFEQLGQDGKGLPDEYKEDEGAIRRARLYSDSSHLSRRAIIDMMTNGIGGSYPPEIARYAVDHIDADWKENAAKSAQLLKDVGTPEDMIYNTLTSDAAGKFTPEEARYGVEQLK